MSGSIPLIPYTISWRTEGRYTDLYFFFRLSDYRMFPLSDYRVFPLVRQFLLLL